MAGCVEVRALVIEAGAPMKEDKEGVVVKKKGEEAGATMNENQEGDLVKEEEAEARAFMKEGGEGEVGKQDPAPLKEEPRATQGQMAQGGDMQCCGDPRRWSESCKNSVPLDSGS